MNDIFSIKHSSRRSTGYFTFLAARSLISACVWLWMIKKRQWTLYFGIAVCGKNVIARATLDERDILYFSPADSQWTSRGGNQMSEKKRTRQDGFKNKFDCLLFSLSKISEWEKSTRQTWIRVDKLHARHFIINLFFQL